MLGQWKWLEKIQVMHKANRHRIDHIWVKIFLYILVGKGKIRKVVTIIGNALLLSLNQMSHNFTVVVYQFNHLLFEKALGFKI